MIMEPITYRTYALTVDEGFTNPLGFHDPSPVFSWNGPPVNQINLADNMLRRRICFRTPRKLKEFAPLSKWRIPIHPKARFGAGKFRCKRFEMKLRRLGVRRGVSSQHHPVRSSWVDYELFAKKFALPSTLSGI